MRIAGLLITAGVLPFFLGFAFPAAQPNAAEVVRRFLFNGVRRSPARTRD